ncbi:hypothetical protein B0I26_12917 [Anoxybacillus vitaminiphilus]|uniref:Uncharacterized protein n=1 Tax=Paranoxybacillus vitaminiphilus TaxID=581036 RepID=A0A327Y3E9_9BACL|nr:hypothetical protein [Anoxybacillus vitaminiphilus]RAK14862.1 hypothetical protein B0I26_12917 [Anoxybacillus vitaminiphilus]
MEAVLVSTLEEVIANVKQFNQDIEDELEIVQQLTQFKHWYYIPSLDAFEPSKYIGYKEMNTARYNRGKGKTGIDTEKVLKQWFVKLPKESVQSQELMEKLYKCRLIFRRI